MEKKTLHRHRLTIWPLVDAEDIYCFSRRHRVNREEHFVIHHLDDFLLVRRCAGVKSVCRGNDPDVEDPRSAGVLVA